MTASGPELVEVYRADAARDELSAALLVAQIIEPSVDAARVRRMFAELCEQCAPDGTGGTPAMLVDALRAAGFRAADDLSSLDASRIDLVLERRRGIPISLSVPYLGVGRALGLPMEGINFPNHFLVRAAGVLIDPLNARELTPADVEQLLAQTHPGQRVESALVVASPDDIAVRMLNNVKAIYASRGDLVTLLALLDCQRPLVTDTAPLDIERADVWWRLGDAAAARAVLEEIAPNLRGTRWEAELDKRLTRLRGQRGPTLH